MQLIKKKAQDFVQQQSQNTMVRAKTIVFKKELPQMKEMTPKERLQRKKQQEADA